jgi:hypothetical protein
MTSDVIARLAAANPVPGTKPAWRLRRSYVLALAAAALLVPAAYGADQLLGISNEGTSVPTSSVLPGETKLDQAMQELRVGSTMQSLGTLNGVAFYATRNAAGAFCIAIDHVGEVAHKGFGCAPDFPTAAKALVFPPAQQLQGVAADGVATVQLLDADGNVLDSATVTNNLFASATQLEPGAAVSVRTLDADGVVSSTRTLR